MQAIIWKKVNIPDRNLTLFVPYEKSTNEDPRDDSLLCHNNYGVLAIIEDKVKQLYANDLIKIQHTGLCLEN